MNETKKYVWYATFTSYHPEHLAHYGTNFGLLRDAKDFIETERSLGKSYILLRYEGTNFKTYRPKLLGTNLVGLNGESWIRGLIGNCT